MTEAARYMFALAISAISSAAFAQAPPGSSGWREFWAVKAIEGAASSILGMLQGILRFMLDLLLQAMMSLGKVVMGLFPWIDNTFQRAAELIPAANDVPQQVWQVIGWLDWLFGFSVVFSYVDDLIATCVSLWLYAAAWRCLNMARQWLPF